MQAAVSEFSHDAPPSWRSYAVPLTVLLASLMLVGWLDFRPTPAQPVLAIFSPLQSPSYAFMAAVAAGGRVVGAGGVRNSIVAQSDDPDFFARLHEAGAWILVDAAGRAGCGSKPKRPK